MKSPAFANQFGQMTMEMMLLMTVFLMVALAVHKQALSNGWVQSIVEGPWTRVQGIIEDGVWIEAGTKSKAFHPSLINRKGSKEGEPAT